MDNEKTFHIGTILSITTGVLCVPNDIYDYPFEGVYDILDWMEGVDHMTLGLVSASDRMKPILLEQFPEFKHIAVPDFSKAVNGHFDSWIGYIGQQFGEYRTVRRPVMTEIYGEPVALQREED